SPLAKFRPARASLSASRVNRCSGARRMERSAPSQTASEFASVKKLPAAAGGIGSTLRNERGPISPPVFQAPRPLGIKLSLAPPLILRMFRLVRGAAEPAKVCDRFQFSLRASAKSSSLIVGLWASGLESVAAKRRF